GEQVLAGHIDGARAHPAVAREVAHDREGCGRLAAAGLADQAVGLPRGDLERDAAEHRTPDAAHAVGDLEVGELERRRGDGRGGHRSNAWVRASRMEVTPSERA